MSTRDLTQFVTRAAVTMVLALGLCVSLSAQGKNPLILIPGLSGSELRHKDTGERIWFKAIRSKTEDLRLPISDDLEKNHDSLIPGDLLRIVKVGPFPVTDVYGGFITAMEIRGGYHEEKWDSPSEGAFENSLFVFPYDWRLDIVENSRRLVRQVEALKLKLKKPELKFDMVGHSMGGLIARYAAMYGDTDLPRGNRKPQPTWTGGRHFDKVILMGTPNEGSASSLDTLLNGFSIGGLRIDLPFVHDTSKFTVFTIPSAYQLMPAPGTLRVFDDKLDEVYVDIYDPRTWSKYGWNVINDKAFASEFKAEERKVAETYFASMLDRAKRLHEALAASQGKSGGVSFYTLGADCKPALDSILVYRDQKSDRWKTLFRPKGFTRTDGVKITDDDLKKVMWSPGDGVVTRRSLAAESQSLAGPGSVYSSQSSMFICVDHHKLAANARIQDYVIDVLDGKRKAITLKEETVAGK